MVVIAINSTIIPIDSGFDLIYMIIESNRIIIDNMDSSIYKCGV